MNTKISTNLKFKRMFLNILSILVILALAFPVTGSASAQETALPQGWHDGLEGTVDANSCVAFGWSVDPDDLDRDVQIRILSDGVEITTFPASDYGEDMDNLGICPEGTCRFTVNLWDLISPDEPHEITVQGYDVETDAWQSLEGTPKSLTCVTPPPPSPHFVVFPEWEFFDGLDWPDGATVSISVEGKDECSLERDSWGGFFNGNFPEGCDIEIGDTVMFADDTTTRTHIVRNLSITAVDPGEDTVMGIADEGTLVYVWPHDAWFEPLQVTANELNEWQVDLGDVGYDIQLGTAGRSEIRDEVGNASAVDWYVPNPRFVVFPEWEFFDGLDWPDGATVSITVEGKPECATTKESSGGFFNGSFGEGCDVVIGDIVTFTDGNTLRTHTVQNLGVTGVDEVEDTVEGTAADGAIVFVWPHATGQQIEATAGPGGIWEADFTGIFDLVPGEGGRSEVRDEFGNATAVDWYIPNPRMVVFPEWEWFDGLDWPDGALVNISVDGKPECATTKESWGGFFNGNFGEGCDLAIGDFVTFTDGETVRTHTVRNLGVTEVNAEEDIVGGTADEGALIYAWPHATGEQLQVTTGITGTWQVDFTDAFDLVEGECGRSEIRDEIGNSTAVDWCVPNPHFTVFHVQEVVEGWDWPFGAVIHLTIDDPNTAASPDHEQDETVVLAPWGSGQLWVWFDFADMYDVKPGDVVTLTDGTTTRTHTVQNLGVTGVDEVADTVEGTAADGAIVFVWPHATGQQVEVTAGSEGTWQADFNGIFDLVPGEAGRSEIRDDAGNATAVDWYVPWPPSIFVVNTTDDIDDGICDEGHCSLREAINTANARAVPDTIVFNIPGDPPFTIQPQFAFPDITDPVVIDGTTQPGFGGSPVIELDGTNAGNWVPGLLITANDSTVKGLVINRFSDNGIILFGSGNTVQGNFIGTDITGTTTTGSASGPAVGAYTVEVLPESCPTYDPGTDRDGFVSESDDPLAPWSGISVTFQGTDEDKCGIPDTFEDVPLIYRYKLVFEEPAELASIAVTGAAFNGGILRVLDANMDVLGTAYTFGGNSFQTNYVVLENVEGTVFYIDEFDYSSDWRFRQSIVINGPLPLGNHGNGVLVAGGATNNSVVENLISGNAANGVGIFNPGTTGNTVQENYIGTDITGTQSLGNAAPGVGIGDQAYDNFIIGNLISGNKSDGVAIFNPGTNGNTLQGNNIGTDASGMAALPNAGVGVWVGEGASNTFIGGTDASVRNVISGNQWGGVSINQLETTGTQVLGNYIGTNKNGDEALPNGGDGVFVSANQSLIGGAEPGAGNLISGNMASGIGITEGASGNLVQGNYIGTDVTGTTSTGPAGPAVGEYTLTVLTETCPTYDPGTDFDGFISESDDPLAPWSGTSVHFVGTDECGSPETSGEASLIYRYKLEFADETQLNSVMVAGAAFNGPDNVLRVLDEDMNILGTANTYGGNSFQSPIVTLQEVVGKVFYIDEFDTSTTWRFRQSIVINGPLPLGNLGSGAAISGGASDNQILGNLISGNRSDAVALYHSGTNGNILQGNYIGTDASGTAALPNTSAGIWIGEGASNTMIGGVEEGQGNVISGNTGDAISLNNSETTGTVIQGNFIGTDVTGTAAVPNLANGIVLVTGTHDNMIGGMEPGAGNVVSGNMGDGVLLVDGGTSGNLLLGNRIGTDVTGMSALGNQFRGVFLGGGASDNLISGNVISSNGAAGIRLIDYGTTGNQIQGNFVGTDITGTNPLGNGYIGIRLTDGASDNLIGGTEPSAGNIIAFNAASGVTMNGEDVTGNTLLSNSVFSNAGLGIDLGEDEVTPNDVLDQDVGPNNLQNFPVLTTVTRFDASVKIHGLLVSSPGTTYHLEFFANDDCDPSGFGEGQTFLGSTDITTNRVGIGSFKSTLPVTIPQGAFITATASDPSGNTSEFSQCFGPTR